ncbi:MAG TPA: YdiU family protein, partial [Alphaproteobacteria bacterium]|nr:YdiU family protein [Alphaproteobacteria bacterium]
DFNNDLAQEMGLDFNVGEYTAYFSGNRTLKGASVISAVYAGHQFGTYVPQLGDGRAHLLGEIESKKNGNSYEIQLKGSGKTPYSRFGDGKAVLRSSIREYLVAEAMHYLGVPTTRSLCIIGSDENVMREGIEKGAMVTRVAPSFLRFGNFQFFSHTKKDEAATKILLDYVIAKFYPRLLNSENTYQKFFYEVVSSTAKLMAKWQAFGFTHGVMNTDNMSILSLTIDYGPYGFMDGFNPNFIPNCSDHSGRYSYVNQPQIGLWNLHALAYALHPILNHDQAQEILQLYKNILVREYTNIMRLKLGFQKERGKDKQTIENLVRIMSGFEADYTLFFRYLSNYDLGGDRGQIYSLFKKTSEIEEWLNDYEIRVKQEGWPEMNRDEEKLNIRRKYKMKLANPKYILRNYMAETAIRMLNYSGDISEVKRLREILKYPFDEQPENDAYAQLPPEWANEISISCSS